jgi:lysyl-tRNA synthetase, class II
MATLQELRDERLRKLEELKAQGINPYPAKTRRTHVINDVLTGFSKLESKEVTVVGRITGIRKFGKIAFVVLKDASGSLQLFLSANDMIRGIEKQGDEETASYKVRRDSTDTQDGEVIFFDLPLLDSGDFVEATGPVVKTKTGEISIKVQRLRLLAKSLRPMPTTRDGFNNKEERLRRRYVDTNVNQEVHDRYVRRSRFWQATRDFLNENGFTEINTPVLEHTTGGADAHPFTTHMDALDEDFYLRISHELPLKRLIGGGYEKVYDIGPRFRNENYSEEHLPEHVAMEWYWAYADWQDGMKFQEELFKYVFNEVYGSLKFNVRGFEVDLSKQWEKIDYAGIIKKKYGIDVYNCTIGQITEQLKAHGLQVEKADNKARGIDKLWKNLRKDIAGPAWLVNTPLFISPLAKVNLDNPQSVQRFQAVMAGSELGNGYSELNDPIDQLNRFVEQQKMREAGDAEAQMLDIDFVEMLEYGMPPTCGWGHSERAFWIFEGVTGREGVPFPQLRAEIDETTKKIYPNLNL